MGGGGGQGEPPNTASLLGVKETPGSLLPLWDFLGEGSSEMGAAARDIKYGRSFRGGWVGREDEGRRERAAEEVGTRVRCWTQVVGEER